MKKVINIHEAKTHLSRLVEQVAAGEELVIGKAGKPLALLVPYLKQQKPRVAGALAGQIVEHEGCWEPDESLLDNEDPLLDRQLLAAEKSPIYKTNLNAGIERE
ncbi:MAG: type II toxin-antitoxin system Phd/YefM family antitoxin [Chthoniobacterales bacterium]